jgi:hypothetical protein
LLGFVMLAPLVALLLVGLVQMAAVVWTREIVAERLRDAVAAGAALGGDPGLEFANLSTALGDSGIEVRQVSWSEVPLGAGENLYEVRLEVLPAGVTLIPGLTTTVSTTAVIE